METWSLRKYEDSKSWRAALNITINSKKHTKGKMSWKERTASWKSFSYLHMILAAHMTQILQYAYAGFFFQVNGTTDSGSTSPLGYLEMIGTPALKRQGKVWNRWGLPLDSFLLDFLHPTAQHNKIMRQSL